MALDEATSSFLAQAAETGAPPLYEMTPEDLRAMNDGFIDLYGPGPDMASVQDVTISTCDGSSIPARVLTPVGTPDGVLIYFHGGGWVVGNRDQFDTLARKLAEGTNCVVVLPDYRLAPEHVYPAAANDAWDVTTWTADRFAGSPLLVGGDSAGGNLAAIVAQRAVREAGPTIAMQVLVYPVTDSDTDNETYRDPANQLMLDAKSMEWFWDLYTPDAATRSNPDASPLQGDVTGVAPAVVLIAEYDVLRGEGEAYVKKLTDAGVPVQSRVFDGQMHGFFQFVNILPGSDAGIDYVTAAVKSHLEAN